MAAAASAAVAVGVTAAAAAAAVAVAIAVRSKRSRRSRSDRSRSERRKMVGPNPGAILMFQSTESDGILTVLCQQDSTSAGIVPSTGRVVAHANT